jgi:hypothetical protein
MVPSGPVCACTSEVGDRTATSTTCVPAVSTEHRRVTARENTGYAGQYGCRQHVDGGAHSHQPPTVE